MTTPDAFERLRRTIAALDDSTATDCYVHMVQSRRYLPVDVLGPKMWRDLTDLFDDDDAALRHIGLVFRGRLGV